MYGRSRDRGRSEPVIGTAQVHVAGQRSRWERRDFEATVPSFEPAGHVTPKTSLWILACATVQASSPCAAEGLRVMPSGSVTDAVLTWDWEFAFGAFGTAAVRS